MKSLALLLALFAAVALAADNDQKCGADFQSFMSCVKDEFQKKPESEKQAAKKEREDKANQCFAQASCDAPDWDNDPMGGMGKGDAAGMQMPPAVKQCLKKKMVEKIGAKFNECLSKKGVKNVNFTALADSFAGSDLEMEGHGEAKEGLEGSFKAKFNAVKAVDKCAQKKGGDTDAVKPLEKCLHNIKKDEKPRMCALIKPCENKVSSAECKKRGEDTHKAMCQCKKEKEADISKKLRALAEGQKKVGIQEMIKTVADDQDMQDMMKQVDACYAETNEPEPPMMKLAMRLFTSGGGSGPGAAAFKAFSVNASTVIILSDMMSLDAEDDSECQPCP